VLPHYGGEFGGGVIGGSETSQDGIVDVVNVGHASSYGPNGSEVGVRSVRRLQMAKPPSRDVLDQPISPLDRG
jgi:hypothetical protein